MTVARYIYTTMAFIVVFVFSASAAQLPSRGGTEDPEGLRKQTHCPVMGGEIDRDVYTDFQGQRVYHCCAMCSDKFKADPDKYFSKAAADGVLFENIQTTCPVSGEELEDKSIYSDYEGRRIAFCCKSCRGKFEKDPGKYLEKMTEDVDTKNNTKMMNHSGHSGHGGHTN